ncbi:hypothetical protein [Caulobacter sp. FWC2]|uniref:hypothetical protein n=1 Tax=Caulobacter sp. FWC2 TaxID=69664 RepID=UPI000C14D0A6|nr:hypothetical protein [Caulobacter sp. FWC2]PIB91063.1 hypothetical protein CSW62_05440 [Caulobacter sp. FWC2]
MRAAFLIAALACAPLACAGAHAETRQESRYGPAPERAPTPVNGRAPGYTGSTYGGRALGWSGKREIAAPQAQAAAQVQPWWAQQAREAQQPPIARAAYQPPAPAYAPQAPQAPSAALPRNIYDAPAPQAAPVPAAYSAPAQPAPRFRDGQIGARTYSVGRQFGMAPDPIPAAGPPRVVLITAPPTLDEDKPREEGNGEWSAKPEKESGQ